MGVFNTSKLIQASPSVIPVMAERISQELTAEGYNVESVALISGGYDISIAKGGVFKAILGLQTALKVTLIQKGNAVLVDAHVGIWGKQVIPFAIAWFVTWPVLLTQIWGLVQQSKLDDRIIQIAEEVARTTPTAAPQQTATRGKFCTNCGHHISGTEKFCPECGSKF